jgi:hypothetical protein
VLHTVRQSSAIRTFGAPLADEIVLCKDLALLAAAAIMPTIDAVTLQESMADEMYECGVKRI